MTEADRLKQLGNAAFKEARFQQAVEHFTAAVALDRTSHLLFSNRSGALAAVGRYQEALEERLSVLNWIEPNRPLVPACSANPLHHTPHITH